MNICIFNGDMSRGGGTERITKILSDILVKNDKYCVWILNLNNPTGESYYKIDDRVQFVTLRKGGVFGKIFSLAKFVYKNKIDILINVDVMLGIFSLPLTCIHPRTKLIAWEMFNIRNDIGSRNTKKIRKLSLMLCDYYVTQTRGDMEAFQKEMNVKVPITYIYNPCIEDINYVGYDVNSKTIVTAGHFFYTKGYDLAVEVARGVFEKYPDWKWEFCGDGVQYDTIKILVKKYGLEKNVIFCGRTSNMAEKYKKASMYVMTSRTEGFGLVLIEAKCYNLPTISFDIDFGPREIVENGVSGYLVNSFDKELMVQRICELIENEKQRISFSNHARDNLSLFSMESFERSWIKIFDEIICKQNRRM